MILQLLERIWRRRGELLLILLMGFLYFFSFVQRVAVPGTIFDELQSGLSLSSSTVTMLGAIYLYMYAGLQVPAGIAIDRFGAVRVILFGGVFLSVGTILFSLSPNLWSLYITRAFVGFGAAFMYLCIVKELDVRFHDRNFSVMLSILLMIGYAGGLFGTFPFEKTVRAYGWRYSILIIGVISVLTVIFTALAARRVPSVKQIPKLWTPISDIRQVMMNRSMYPLSIAGGLIFATYFVIQAVIGKKLLSDCCGLSSSASAGLTFITMLTLIGAVFLTGAVPKLIGDRRKPIQIAACLGIAAATGLMVINLTKGASPSLIMVSYLLLAASAASAPIFTSSMKELNPPQVSATSVGVGNMISYLFVAVLTTLAGVGLDLFKDSAVVTKTAIIYPPAAYRFVFMGLFVLSICALICAVFIRETRGRNVWTGLG